MAKRKILITGGAGFLGRNIARGLAGAGHDVVVLDNFLFGEKPVDIADKNIEWVVGDVQDRASMSAAADGCDFIFHFAGIIGGDMGADYLREDRGRFVHGGGQRRQQLCEVAGP